RRMLALLVTGVAVSLVSHVVYEAPWTATLCYPLVCVGGGTACAAAGGAVAGLVGRVAWPGASVGGTTARLRWASYAAGLALALACAAVTNLDLVGLPAFALDWWRSYTPMRSRF
ncbi:MAG: hypothetical protein M3442_10130, partial [Chloroflexota bacterium]|nr:hypothetical protein [Chloroflexota bacterium]